MTLIPDYHDTLSVANLTRGKLPFYILDITVDTFVALHHHDFAELTFVYEGSGSEVINGRLHPLQPGTSSFLLPHHLHEIRSSPGRPLRMYCCMFDISILFGSRYDFELAGRMLQTGNAFPSYTDFGEDQRELVRNIFLTIHKEHSGAGSFGKFSFIRVKLLEAMLLFARTQERHATNANPPVQKKTIWDIIQYVHLHYADKLTLETLSEQFRISSPYISHSFKKLYGQGFLEYLQTLRINSAISLLASTDMLVSDVAAEVGFDSYRNFTRVFRKKKGMTPGEYRESFLASSYEMPKTE